MGSNTSKPSKKENSSPFGVDPVVPPSPGDGTPDDSPHAYPRPSGREYDLIDELASELPAVIDDESRRQVEEYMAACDGGKGPMVACHSTAEYLSLFERKHVEAMKLFENCCFRPASDRSPNGVAIASSGGDKAYAPSCYNLAQFRMTGKGRTKFDRGEGYRLFERACEAGHHPGCMMQGKMLVSHPGSLGTNVPYDPPKAMELFEDVCRNGGDSLACFTLATMLLRGDRIDPAASNVSPAEASGRTELAVRTGEGDRRRREDDRRITIPRNPAKAESLMLEACERSHAPSCYNLAVMYQNGDDGVKRDPEKAKKFQEKTEKMVKLFGGFGFNAPR